MINGESQIDTDINLYFVVPNKCESEDDCTEDMWHAYNVSIFAVTLQFTKQIYIYQTKLE